MSDVKTQSYVMLKKRSGDDPGIDMFLEKNHKHYAHFFFHSLGKLRIWLEQNQGDLCDTPALILRQLDKK